MNISPGVLGSAIKTARLKKKFTQEKLAELINITPMHLKQLESERRKPSFEVLYKLSYVLNLSLDSLFFAPDDEMQELRNKVNLSLNKCSKHELSIIYATIEAMLAKNE